MKHPPLISNVQIQAATPSPGSQLGQHVIHLIPISTKSSTYSNVTNILCVCVNMERCIFFYLNTDSDMIFYVTQLTCRSVFSSSVASSCLPSLAITNTSWIILMRFWQGGGAPLRPSRSPEDHRLNELCVRLQALNSEQDPPVSDAAPFVCLVPIVHCKQTWQIVNRTPIHLLICYSLNLPQRMSGEPTQNYDKNLLTPHLKDEEPMHKKVILRKANMAQYGKIKMANVSIQSIQATV